MNERKKSISCLQKQAEKILKSSSSRFDPLEIGSTVKVSIPDVDRARGAPRNLLAVVIHVENDLYKLCTEHGYLKHKYTRSELVPCKEKLLDLPKSIEEKELTLREAAGLSSISGTQGYQRCHCKTKCKNNKCACRSSGKLCNSKCHGSLICENK
ncbi:uncharacterized protein LOC112592727 [Melanaphis sacchari]|uniref:uncharacterized protein LOC112592727 n=1 Tax=Melanaphis sacchari TaxID=742174 RepID=UPI000DC156C5|nr:uncharacterized protein LOC112592727 [Melanaphis sacchari]